MRIVSRAARLAALLLVAFAVATRSAGAASAPGASQAAAGSAAAKSKKTSPPPAARAPSPPPIRTGASLLVPAVPDTFPRESEPAPFLVPGRPIAVDTTQTREKRARAFLAAAQQLERRGQLSTALAAYNSALMLDTTITGVAFHVGRIYQTLEDPELAARAFAQEVRRDSTNVAAAIELGISLAQMGREASAVARLEALTRRVPNDDQAWSALGFAYHAAGHARDAEGAMRKALAVPPERASEHRDLGALLASEGREREARAEFQRAIAMDPKDAAVWVNLGNLERRAGRDEQALEAYRAAEARDSSQVLALQGQAQTLAALGHAREAEAAYRRWIERRPADFGVQLEAIQYFVTEGRADMALETARGAVRIDPHSPDAYLMLGVALDASGDKRGALDALRRAEALATDRAGEARARQLIATLRAGAPDSLRTLFAADSVEHERPER